LVGKPASTGLVLIEDVRRDVRAQERDRCRVRALAVVELQVRIIVSVAPCTGHACTIARAQVWVVEVVEVVVGLMAGTRTVVIGVEGKEERLR
jgi:hypothetical protein